MGNPDSDRRLGWTMGPGEFARPLFVVRHGAIWRIQRFDATIHAMSDAARLTAALADRYRIERELGAGGMATVYLAHDLKHDRDVAIQGLHEGLGAPVGPP